MIVWDDTRTIMQRLAQDNSVPAGLQLDLMANVGYKMVLNKLGRQVTEKVLYAATVPTQRAYQLPPDAAWVKNLALYRDAANGDYNTKDNLTEIQSEQAWDGYTQSKISGRPVRYFYRPRFGHGGGLLELDPIPSSADDRLGLTFESTDKDMTKLKYNTGTITVIKGSEVVNGVGTTFASDMQGRYLRLTGDGTDRLWYRVRKRVGNTQLKLENVYEGDGAGGQAYEICEAFNLPEDLQMAPIYYSLWHWWETKKDPVYSSKFQALWEKDLTRAKTWHGSKTRNSIVQYEEPMAPFQGMPGYFPESVS